MENLAGKSVLVLGGNGFFGRHVCNVLRARSALVYAPRSRHLDLGAWDSNEFHEYVRSYEEMSGLEKVDYCICMAAFSGGIIFNKKNPIKIFNHNYDIGSSSIWLSDHFGAKKTLFVATSCSYPHHLDVMVESEFENGPCHPSIYYFGQSKRAVYAYAKAYNEQLNSNIITAAVTNLFGEGDTTDFTKCKVVGSLIMKFLNAKAENQPTIQMFGDGSPKRDLLYAPDAAEYLVRALERYEDTSEPINIGSGHDVSIKFLAGAISSLIEYEGEILWEDSDSGQKKKLLDTSKMERILGPLDYESWGVSLDRTINYYRSALNY
jgi:GDP-L-fucose synthase